EPAGSRMDHHAHLTRLRDPEGLCGALVVDPVDLLDFNEVVSGPEAPDLVLAACGRPLADLREVGVFESAARLDVVGVVGPRVPLVDRPADALRRELREVLPRDFGDAAFAHAARDASTLFTGPFSPSTMGTEKPAYMSSAHKRSRPPRVRRKLHACSVLSPITGWDELRIALPASPSVGMRGRDSWGPGSLRTGGR